ncbi:MAG: UPF0280 family protein [Candidatus Omnitrophica bacterium]|nr:UPF0280 family protein [Candidatus Omnitrophota bacterium]MBU1932846.1 UPF0280 family protein [Candidatus Omnitrophota bacterium]
MGKNKHYQERFYRKWVNSGGLLTREVIVGETDVFVSAEKDFSKVAEGLVKECRAEIESYIKKHPGFKTSLEPLSGDKDAADIVKDMIRSSRLAGVGPMASVAGAVSEFVGKGLLRYTDQVIVENGGDVFIKSTIERTVAVFAGDSPLSNRLFIKIKPGQTPLGICTSSGTVSHSLSFGKADACVIISRSAALADALATAACNRVKKAEDIRTALSFALSIKGILGALVIYGKDFGVSGDIELA